MSYQHDHTNLQTPYRPNSNYRPPRYTLPDENNGNSKIIDVRTTSDNRSTLRHGFSTTILTLSGLLGLALSIYVAIYFLNMAYQFNTDAEFIMHGEFLYDLPHWIRAIVLISCILPTIAMGAKYGKTTLIISLILVLPTIAIAALPDQTLQDILVNLPGNKL